MRVPSVAVRSINRCRSPQRERGPLLPSLTLRALSSRDEDWSGFLEQTADGVEDPLLVGELARAQLGVNQGPIRLQLEAAALRRDQLEVVDLLFVFLEQLARQTDGLRLVVSHGTIRQLEIHESLLPGRLQPLGVHVKGIYHCTLVY